MGRHARRLNRMDRGLGSFISFRKRDGLPDSSIQAIQEDGQGTSGWALATALVDFSPSRERSAIIRYWMACRATISAALSGPRVAK
jgi:hypothetical protein